MPAQEVGSLPQRGAGVLLVLLGPEKRQQGVPAMEGAGCGQRQIAQQGQPPRLHQYGLQVLTLAPPQLDATEHIQLDHGESGSVIIEW